MSLPKNHPGRLLLLSDLKKEKDKERIQKDTWKEFIERKINEVK